MKALAAIAVAALTCPCIAQELHVDADKTHAEPGDTITWTVTATGIGPGNFLQAYDLDFVASDSALGTASLFMNALPTGSGVSAGSTSGATLNNAWGGQSTIIDPIESVSFGDVTLGTFTVVVGDVTGSLTYTVQDGGQLSTDRLRTRVGSDFGTVAANGPAFTYFVDSVLIPSQPFTLHLTPDASTVAEGDTIVWTVSITGDFAPTDYVQQYDLSFLASDPTLGVVSTFMDNLNPALSPSPGSPDFADLTGVSGAQSSILGPTVNGPIVLGTFAVLATEEGELTYDVADGGSQPTNHLQIKPGSDFAPAIFNTRPNIDAATVTILPLFLPMIIQQPTSLVSEVGGALQTLGVIATDVDTYQWLFDGQPVADGSHYLGAQTDTLVIVPTLDTEGTYKVVLSNFSGDITSQPAVLAVKHPCIADVNADGALNVDDIQDFVESFLSGCD